MYRPAQLDAYDVEAVITYIPTEKGGRKQGIPSGHWAQIHYQNEDAEVGQYFEDGAWVLPGDTVSVRLRFMTPEYHRRHLEVGTVFLIREGQKTVGYGRITRFLDLEKHAEESESSE